MGILPLHEVRATLVANFPDARPTDAIPESAKAEQFALLACGAVAPSNRDELLWTAHTALKRHEPLHATRLFAQALEDSSGSEPDIDAAQHALQALAEVGTARGFRHTPGAPLLASTDPEWAPRAPIELAPRIYADDRPKLAHNSPNTSEIAHLVQRAPVWLDAVIATPRQPADLPALQHWLNTPAFIELIDIRPAGFEPFCDALDAARRDVGILGEGR